MPAYCVGTNFPILITNRNTPGMPGYVDIEMQTNQQYIAFGHNTLPPMVSVISYPKQTFENYLMNEQYDRFGKPQ